MPQGGIKRPARVFFPAPTRIMVLAGVSCCSGVIMAQLLSVMLALSPSLMVDSRDVLGLGEVKHVMAGDEYNVRQQLSQVSTLYNPLKTL